MDPRLRFPRPWWRVSLAAGLLAGAATLDKQARAEDAPPETAKARWTTERASDAARKVWGPPLEERLQGWKRTDRFEEIRSAVDTALLLFPDPEAVALVVGAVRHINSSNVRWDSKPAGLDAWNVDVALRALAHLPRPPRLEDHYALIQGVLRAWWATPLPVASAEAEANARRDLALVAQFIRRLLDDADRLWTPLPRVELDGRYVPVRRSDPRWRSQGSRNTPADEEGFLVFEETWYAERLRESELWTLRDIRGQLGLPHVVSAFARRFPTASLADTAYLERMPADVPEFPWVALLDAARGIEARQSMRSSPGVYFRITGRQGGSPALGQVGYDVAIEVSVLNLTDVTRVIPLGLARAAVVHGDGPRDEDALPPPRSPLATDLVTVAPNHSASVPLSLPMSRGGLTRVVVAVDSDAAKIGDTEGVWTGREREVMYLDVPALGPRATRGRLLVHARESAGRPDRVSELLAAIATIEREEPDERGAEACGEIAVAGTDDRVAGAALAVVEAALARGYGVGAHGSLLTIAMDGERPRELRIRAVDGLVPFATGRISGRFIAGPQVQVVSDVAVPPRVRAHVRERLELLSRAADVLVAERAQAALAR